ncbi:hypothetical protein JB92DRAFT_3111342 [Gautieria morchelliformis]|nr:hypothetical protein JB92DRAFT_3111342 [Gautieria morchelliformis]
MPLVITAGAKAKPTVTHIQLRHLLSCPQRRGIVYYVSGYAILERNLLSPATRPHTLVNLDFFPTCFATALVPSDPDFLLLAVGSIDSQLHLSLYSLQHPATASPHTRPKPLWFHLKRLRPQHDVVNYMFFSPAELTDDTRAPRRKTSASSSPADHAAADPTPSDLRLVVCGNDKAVHFFDIDLRTPPSDHQRLRECGVLRLDTCVNHASISPDGRTLLCVGDTPRAYLFRIIPGAFIACEPLATYTFPMPPYQDPGPLVPCDDPPSYVSLRPHTYRPTIHTYPTTHCCMPARACFATAWTSDGLKFAVAAQEGALAVWDVRSSVPVWVFWTGLRPPSVQQYGARTRMRAVPAGTNAWVSDGASSEMGEPAADAREGVPPAASANPSASPSQPPPGHPRLDALDLPLSFPSEGNSGGSADSSSTSRVPTTFPSVGHPVPAVVSEPEPDALMGTQYARDLMLSGPDNGIRNLQFSTGDAGRELCVFVEHTTNIHVIDARTFDPSTHRVFAFPDVGELLAASATRGAVLSSEACPHAEAAPVPVADAAPSSDAALENAAELGAGLAAPAEVHMQSADEEASTVGTRNGTPEWRPPVPVELPAPQPPSIVWTSEPSPPRAPQITGLCFDPTGEWVLRFQSSTAVAPLQEGQVRLKTLAFPINPIDNLVIIGRYPVKPKNTFSGERIIGYDGVFQVVESRAPSNLTEGDYVIPRDHVLETWRTHATAESSQLLKIPRPDPRAGAILKMGACPHTFSSRIA